MIGGGAAGALCGVGIGAVFHDCHTPRQVREVEYRAARRDLERAMLREGVFEALPQVCRDSEIMLLLWLCAKHWIQVRHGLGCVLS